MKKVMLSLLSAALLATSACNSSGNASDNAMDSATSGDSATTTMPADATAEGSPAANSTAPTDMNANSAGAMLTDEEFMKKADEGGHNEIELSKLALSKGVTGDVKAFATKMVADHTKAGDELKPIAASKNVKLPGTMDAEHQAIKDQLNPLTGKDFEKAYMDQMTTDHVKTVALLQGEIQNGKDADAKAWASKTLPVVQQHTDMAQKHSNMKM